MEWKNVLDPLNMVADIAMPTDHLMKELEIIKMGSDSDCTEAFWGCQVCEVSTRQPEVTDILSGVMVLFGLR